MNKEFINWEAIDEWVDEYIEHGISDETFSEFILRMKDVDDEDEGFTYD